MEKEYNKLFQTLKKSNDQELAHMLQDKIYRKFVRDIVKNKFKNEKELNKIAELMYDNVVKNDKNWWYA